MAITRRQFVTRLGALAAAAGLSQSQIAKITESFAYGVWGSGKPKVVWVHGAECTGCSTSVLGLFEDARGTAIMTGDFAGTQTITALDLAVGGDGAAPYSVPRTLDTAGYNVDDQSDDGDMIVNIQDVLIDVIELDYHETVMNMGGDLAAQWLKDFMDNMSGLYVLVVEGAVQDKSQGGAWSDTAGNGFPWCSIGMSKDAAYTGATLTSGFDHSFDDVVAKLAAKAAATIAIGQCATFGGYPGCKSPLDSTSAGFDTSQSQTGAKGVYDFLYDKGGIYRQASASVVNVPGCPTNPWWFILTVVAVLVDVDSVLGSGGTTLGVVTGTTTDDSGNTHLVLGADSVDTTRRLKAAYPTAIHGPYCPRFNDWSGGRFAEKPGDPGCLQKIGCKGPAVKSLCGLHGWNAQQPENDTAWEFGLATANPAGSSAYRGGHCTRAGHPCMGCTEKGYPDSFVPFVKW